MTANQSIWRGLMTLMMLFVLNFSSAQQARITGKVSDPNNQPLPGATVLVKGTTRGTVTDVDGSYAIEASPQDVLVFSFVGFETLERTVGNSTIIDISLSEGVALTEVVVTALGVKRETKALGYSVQEVQGDQFTEARETNVINSLSGRVAGVQITNGTSGLGGSTRVTIRGESSLNINANQPLFVVDGIPISNNVVGSSGSGNQEVDYGNAAGGDQSG